MKIFIFISCSLFISLAQDVQTIARNPLINDGMFVGKSGTIYTTVGGLIGGTAIGRVRPSGEVSKLSDGFKGTIDVYTTDEILFFATNYDDNSLKSYSKKSEQVKTLSAKLDGPASIAVDETGLLYISNFGSPPSFSGSSVSLFNPKNNKLSTFIEDKRLFRPQGIVYDKKGAFYIANTPNGKMFKLVRKTKKLDEFTFLNTQIGNLEIKDKTLFASSNRANRIYVVDLDGNFMSFSGDGTGNTKDGSINDAQFLSPLGLALSVDKKTLYVAQAKDGALRAINIANYSFNLKTELKNAKIKVDIHKSELAINSAKLPISSIQVHSLTGKKVADLQSKSEGIKTVLDIKTIERPFILSFEQGKKRFGIKVK